MRSNSTDQSQICFELFLDSWFDFEQWMSMSIEQWASIGKKKTAKACANFFGFYRTSHSQVYFTVYSVTIWCNLRKKFSSGGLGVLSKIFFKKKTKTEKHFRKILFSRNFRFGKLINLHRDSKTVDSKITQNSCFISFSSWSKKIDYSLFESEIHFSCLLEFLKMDEEITAKLIQL